MLILLHLKKKNSTVSMTYVRLNVRFLSDCYGIWIHNHLVSKRTLNEIYYWGSFAEPKFDVKYVNTVK